MHDRDELCLELVLYIMGDMFNGRSDGVVSSKWGVYDEAKAFDLEVSFVHGFKGATIVEITIKWYGKVGVSDGSDEHGMFSG